MNKEYIQSLLENYFEGLTSLQEEQLLREYFQSDAVDADLKVYQPMFQYFAILSPSKKRASIKGRGLWWAAACITLCIGSYFLFSTQKALPKTSIAYINGKKYTNIKLIQAQALKALENMSEDEDDIYSAQVEALEIFITDN
ncbi:MAG: hypothetical protein EZS26_001517 [Candidatus Ordinivivax streblomastigis]|uniref:Uncharacterized protein n=1 Tax=Candidatus Ordinivivax streblomastigis TaxID=2540710 RepID=A0A5M8P1Y8_9BACT|nr:MAG: hypothetical protein EZS26_001517 [Candidatus Ordinivivax streblomastigis]